MFNRRCVHAIASLLLLLSSAGSATAWVNETDGNVVYGMGAPRSRITDVAGFPDGSVVIVGAIEDAPTGPFLVAELDWFASRIDWDGSVLWATEIESGEDSDDQAQRVAIDGDGNVFVAGQMWNSSASQYQARIIKLDGSTGNQLDGAFFQSYIDFYNPHFIRDLAVDAAGNPVIASGFIIDFKVMKLDGDDLGQELWSYTVAAADEGESYDVAFDGAGDVLVAGTLTNVPNPSRPVVAKLDGDTGMQIWKNETLPALRIWHGLTCDPPAYQQNQSVPCGSTAATNLLAASNGDAIVLAEQSNGNPLIARLNTSNGAVIWSETIPGMVGRSIVADSSAVYVAGAGGGSLDEFAIAAIDVVTGDLSWSETYGPGIAKDIDLTSGGKPAAVGMHKDGASEYRFGVVAAEPADGAQAWSNTVVRPYGDGLCIAQTADGHLIAGGTTVDFYLQYNRGFAAGAKFLSGDGSVFECGDGVLEGQEECDDHNVANGDCCSSACTLDPEDTPCDDGLACSTTDQCNYAGLCEPRAGDCCGDGITQISMGEHCDVDVSCCVDCHYTPGAACNYGFHPPCNPLPGVCHRTQCDDAASICSCCSFHSGRGCDDSDCEACAAGFDTNCGFSNLWDQQCVSIAFNECAAVCNCTAGVCGNGTLQAGEQCDDGNTTSGDCCSSTCQLEGCACGNGTTEGSEQCDDGNTTSGDCCSSTCQLEGCACGNGTINAGEQCDDGNTTSGDCCSSTCQLEGCACGNGTTEGSEQCDDGNTTSGDCCSSTCQLEGNGAGCNDGLYCTQSEECQGGVCGGGTARSCTDVSACTSDVCDEANDVCVNAVLPPSGTCDEAGATQISMKATSVDKIGWKWGKGPAIDPAAFGNPRTDPANNFSLCFYDENDQLLTNLNAPYHGVAWSPPKNGAFKFKDSTKYDAPNILTGMRLKPGDTGKGKLSAKGKRTNLAFPTLPITASSLRVQLRRENGPECWQSTFLPPYDTNVATEFKDSE